MTILFESSNRNLASVPIIMAVPTPAASEIGVVAPPFIDSASSTSSSLSSASSASSSSCSISSVCIAAGMPLASPSSSSSNANDVIQPQQHQEVREPQQPPQLTVLVPRARPPICSLCRQAITEHSFMQISPTRVESVRPDDATTENCVHAALSSASAGASGGVNLGSEADPRRSCCFHDACLRCHCCATSLVHHKFCHFRDGRVLCTHDYDRLYRCKRCCIKLRPSDLVMRTELHAASPPLSPSISLKQEGGMGGTPVRHHFVFHERCFSCDECACVLRHGQLYHCDHTSGRILCERHFPHAHPVPPPPPHHASMTSPLHTTTTAVTAAAATEEEEEQHDNNNKNNNEQKLEIEQDDAERKKTRQRDLPLELETRVTQEEARQLRHEPNKDADQSIMMLDLDHHQQQQQLDQVFSHYVNMDAQEQEEEKNDARIESEDGDIMEFNGEEFHEEDDEEADADADEDDDDECRSHSQSPDEGLKLRRVCGSTGNTALETGKSQSSQSINSISGEGALTNGLITPGGGGGSEAAAAAAAAVLRQKRIRTSFKHQQLRTMKAYFQINHNPDAKDLKHLTQKTGLSKRVLQVWFQNARAKFRRSVTKQQHQNAAAATVVVQQLQHHHAHPHVHSHSHAHPHAHLHIHAHSHTSSMLGGAASQTSAIVSSMLQLPPPPLSTAAPNHNLPLPPLQTALPTPLHHSMLPALDDCPINVTLEMIPAASSVTNANLYPPVLPILNPHEPSTYLTNPRMFPPSLCESTPLFTNHLPPQHHQLIPEDSSASALSSIIPTNTFLLNQLGGSNLHIASSSPQPPPHGPPSLALDSNLSMIFGKKEFCQNDTAVK